MCMWAIAESLWVRMLIHCCPAMKDEEKEDKRNMRRMTGRRRGRGRIEREGEGGGEETGEGEHELGGPSLSEVCPPSFLKV